MYFHIGGSRLIPSDDIVGVFDLDSATVSGKTRDFLARAQQDGRVKDVTSELPKTFIVDGNNTVWLSGVSSGTLYARSRLPMYDS